MMKLNRKYGIVALVLVAILCVGIGYAAFTVYSNSVGVTLSYVANVYQVTYSGSTITVHVQVTDNGVGINGATVGLWESPDNVNWAWVGNYAATNSGGYIDIPYAAGGNGNYYFQAQYVVP